MSITINPSLTSNAAGSFSTDTVGYIQGTALNDPAVRNALAGGILKSDETLPMWGGVGLSENVPGSGGVNPPSDTLGGTLIRATSLTANAAGELTGWSVFDQNNAAINSPQSQVPLSAQGMLVNFYRKKSGARIAVKCDPSLVSDRGQVITSKVSWDFVNQQLIPYASATVSSGVYDNGTGIATLTTAAPHGLTEGDPIVPALTGTGSFTNLNVPQIAGAGTTGSTITFTAAVGLTLTITGGTVGTGGLLDVRLLDVSIGKSMTVSYDSGTGFANWDRNGNVAIILI